MPPLRHQAQSGPYTRNQLLGLNQYVASQGYRSLGRWDRAKSSDVYVVRGSVARKMPVESTIVGDLTSDSHMLQPHGSYNPTYLDTPELVGRKAKLQYTVQRPSIDKDLATDYDSSVVILSDIQTEVSRTKIHKNFIEGDQLRFNFNLFEPKTSVPEDNSVVEAAPQSDSGEGSEKDLGSDTVQSDDSADELMEDESSPSNPGSTSSVVKGKAKPELYKVSPSYVEMWRETEKRFNNRIMPVYGPNRSLVPYHLFPKFLRAGTTVVVSFNLIHYAFKDDNHPGGFLYDGYTANVTEVIILDLHDDVPSKPLSTPKRKGRFISQASPSHATLKFAADTFLPAPTQASPAETEKKTADKGKQSEDRGNITPLAGTSKSVSDTVLSEGSSRTDKGPSFLEVVALANAAATRAGESGSPVDEALLRRLLPVIAEYFQASLSSDVGATASPGEDLSVEGAAASASTSAPFAADSGVSTTSTGHILSTSPSDNPQLSSDVRVPHSAPREGTINQSARQASSVDGDIGNASEQPPAPTVVNVDDSPIAGGQDAVPVAKESSSSGASGEVQSTRGNQEKRESRRRK